MYRSTIPRYVPPTNGKNLQDEFGSRCRMRNSIFFTQKPHDHLHRRRDKEAKSDVLEWGMMLKSGRSAVASIQRIGG